MRRSLILDATVRLVFDGAMVLAVYLLFAGHNQPGGGFIGGLVAGSAIALRYVAGGTDEIHWLLPVRPWTLLAAGLVITASMALIPTLAGGEPLDHTAWSFSPPALGDVKVTTATFFDTGVFLIVIGLVLMVFEGLGDEPVAAPPTDPPADAASLTKEVGR
jgi:multisubunit Na+/H+ antiporter MnhB subunit